MEAVARSRCRWVMVVAPLVALPPLRPAAALLLQASAAMWLWWLALVPKAVVLLCLQVVVLRDEVAMSMSVVAVFV